MNQKATTNISEQLFIKETVEHAIKKQRLKPGQLLLEPPLAKIFNTDRASIKRVLELLQQQGLVVKHEGRGYLVSWPECDKINPIRIALSEDMFLRDDPVFVFNE
ncbi:hypothetical protein VIBNISOn1_1390004 [Vibrio nigripulchritudo SOn1]|uniref:HTH gntR-type domain-containing protein n=1 Tax=Vibrio nigripulchritudo SOn1 TaxID=1238450 RepID=A0AAV2VKA5_9VIBR|nr:GntR family transcriptional regulator [Vibrio nigripulchritudo]CCO45125.1 hypothetical protein VIBNISOn1_1390004 [Vibrio nigripulchritudo SOn1]